MAYNEDQSKRNIPLCYDILEQILVLLPLKTLIRLKSVSTQFRDIVSSPTFLKSHLNSDRLVTQISLSRTTRNNPRSISISSGDSKFFEIQIVVIDNPVTAPIQSIFSSCNGLLLVATQNQVLLWNPSIREHIKLVRGDHIGMILDKSNMPDKNILFGLGYNSLLDEYKVIHFNCRAYGANKLCILSCRIGYWKRVACDFPYDFSDSRGGVTVNGCPHWIIYSRNIFRDYDDMMKGPMRLVYFDTVDDKLNSLSVPIGWQWIPMSAHALPYLSVFGGRLCACVSNTWDVSSNCELWVMNEFGVEHSWIKLFVIAKSLMNESVRPYGFLNNNSDEVVLVYNVGNIVTYNLKTKELKSNSRDCMKEFPTWEYPLVEYSESLVSPCRFARGGKRKSKGKFKMLLWVCSGL